MVCKRETPSCLRKIKRWALVARSVSTACCLCHENDRCLVVRECPVKNGRNIWRYRCVLEPISEREQVADTFLGLIVCKTEAAKCFRKDQPVNVSHVSSTARWECHKEFALFEATGMSVMRFEVPQYKIMISWLSSNWTRGSTLSCIIAPWCAWSRREKPQCLCKIKRRVLATLYRSHDVYVIRNGDWWRCCRKMSRKTMV